MPINNSGSFFNNFQNSFNFAAPKAPAPNTPAAPLNPLQNLVPAQLNNQMQTPQAQPVLPNTEKALESAVKELVLNEQQTVNTVKDLMQMPKNIEQLFVQLTAASAGKNPVHALLLQNLNLQNVSALLQGSSKEATANLYRMLAEYNQTGVKMKDSQISKLSELISFVSASSASDVQSLKTLILMYLPWLPLNDPEAFKLEIGTSGTDGSAEGLDSTGILISTKNYGNIQAQILKTDEDGIKIEVITSETFPVKDFIELMKLESRKHNININIDCAVKEAFNKDKLPESQTKVFLNTSPGVNPFLLIISNAFIKNVHEIDIKEDLRWKQKAAEENGES